MNNAQLLTALRQLLLLISGALVARGVLSSTDASLFVQVIEIALPLLISIGTVVWGQIARTDKSQIASVSAMPGIAEIRVKDDAKDGAAQAAADPALENVKPVSAP